MNATFIASVAALVAGQADEHAHLLQLKKHAGDNPYTSGNPWTGVMRVVHKNNDYSGINDKPYGPGDMQDYAVAVQSGNAAVSDWANFQADMDLSAPSANDWLQVKRGVEEIQKSYGGDAYAAYRVVGLGHCATSNGYIPIGWGFQSTSDIHYVTEAAHAEVTTTQPLNAEVTITEECGQACERFESCGGFDIQLGRPMQNPVYWCNLFFSRSHRFGLPSVEELQAVEPRFRGVLGPKDNNFVDNTGYRGKGIRTTSWTNNDQSNNYEPLVAPMPCYKKRR